MKNRSFSRLLRSLSRKEPISSFILTVGAVDAVIGGVGGRSSLMLLGVGAIGVAIALRGWALRRRPIQDLEETPGRSPTLYLPSQSSRPQLPLLQSRNSSSR